jgi:transcriptional regulator with XRE-family HTH domain
MIADLAKFLQ